MTHYLITGPLIEGAMYYWTPWWCICGQASGTGYDEMACERAYEKHLEEAGAGASRSA